jgi:hypothetical protein
MCEYFSSANNPVVLAEPPTPQRVYRTTRYVRINAANKMAGDYMVFGRLCNHELARTGKAPEFTDLSELQET